MALTTRVLLTGSTGFIGGNLLTHLMRTGYEVSAVFRSAKRPESGLASRVKEFVIRMDEVDEWRAPLQGIDVVFHVAGATSGSETELMQANRDVTAALMDACALCECPPTVVLLSSLAAAGPSPKGQPRTTELPPSPVSAYGRSKLAGEVAAIERAHKVPLSILRPGIVFGPGDVEVMQLLDAIAKIRLNPLVGWHDPNISFIHVEDLISAMMTVAQCGDRCTVEDSRGGVGPGIYFVADEEQITFSKFGKYVGSALGVKRVYDVRLPVSVASAAAWMTQTTSKILKRKNTFTTDKILEAAAPSWECDVRPLMNRFGWSPSYRLEQRLQQFAKSKKIRQTDGSPSIESSMLADRRSLTS